jgi:hypothetical protein
VGSRERRIITTELAEVTEKNRRNLISVYSVSSVVRHHSAASI